MPRAAAILALLTIVAACATPQHPRPTDAEAAWSQRRSILGAQQAWALEGKLAVTADGEGWFAGLNWLQSGEHFQIDLMDSFGRIVARIKRDDDGVALTRRDGTIVTAATPESLMQEVYGWVLPISGLRYWVLGMPEPGTDPEGDSERRLDAYGRLAALKQAGWSVDYEDYTDLEPVALPDKITVTGHDLRLKLIVDTWDMAGTSDRWL
jgi:outer membrane lipoprotein LolB